MEVSGERLFQGEGTASAVTLGKEAACHVQGQEATVARTDGMRRMTGEVQAGTRPFRTVRSEVICKELKTLGQKVDQPHPSVSCSFQRTWSSLQDVLSLSAGLPDFLEGP